MRRSRRAPPDDRVASTTRVDDEPERGTDAHEQQRARVDAADGQDHQREQGRIAPAAPAHRAHREPDEPRQPGPRQEQHRDPGRERELVRREHVDERARDRARATACPSMRNSHRAPSAAASEIEPSQRRCATQSGIADVVDEPEERPHREQVADDLVGDGAEPDVRVPQVRRPARAAGRDRGRGTASCRQ